MTLPDKELDEHNNMAGGIAGDNTRHANESRYVQQHLANERTFLAWVRTTISILGVGFVTTTIHVELTGRMHLHADLLVQVIGFMTLALAFTALIFATYSYLDKRAGINNGSFRSTAKFVVVFSATIIATLVVMSIYLVVSY